MSLTDFKRLNGTIYDRARVRVRDVLRKLMLNDLHLYVKHIGLESPAQIRKYVSTDDDMPQETKDYLVEVRGLEWFHNIILDLYRYILRDSEEDIFTIPFHTSLREVLIEAHIERIPYMAYYPSVKQIDNPIVVQGKWNAEKSLYTFNHNPDVPKIDGREKIRGLVIIVEPRNRYLFFGLPRGRLKSILSAAVQAWYAERNPGVQQMLVAFNEPRLSAHMGYVKRPFENTWARNIFSKNRPAGKNESASWKETELTLVPTDQSKSAPADPTIIGATLKTSTTGAHPQFIRWDDVENKNSWNSQPDVKIMFSLHSEQITNLLPPGGIFIDVGTIWGEDGLNCKLMTRATGQGSRSVIAATWDDADIEADGYGHSMCLKYSKKYMLETMRRSKSSDFAKNHELRSEPADDMLMNPTALFYRPEASMFRSMVRQGLDKIVIVTDPIRKSGDRAVDYMAGCALGLKVLGGGGWQPLRVYLLGVYHTRARDVAKRIICAKFLSKIIRDFHMMGNTPVFQMNTLMDYVETQGMDEETLTLYRKTCEIEMIDRKMPYAPKLIELTTKGRSKSERISELLEKMKVLSMTGSFIRPPEYTFRSAKVGGVIVNQIDEMNREMRAWEPGSTRTHDDILDVLAYALEELNPPIDYTMAVRSAEDDDDVSAAEAIEALTTPEDGNIPWDKVLDEMMTGKPVEIHAENIDNNQYRTDQKSGIERFLDDTSSDNRNFFRQ